MMKQEGRGAISSLYSIQSTSSTPDAMTSVMSIDSIRTAPRMTHRNILIKCSSGLYISSIRHPFLCL